MKWDFDAKYFDPAKKGVSDDVLQLVTMRAGENPSYVYSSKIVLAVNLALATRRPLFVGGAPGTGKTTLARNVAEVLGWRYYQSVITSRMRAKDVMWTFDSLRRLSDAQERDKPLPPRAAYVQPQVLWWAFDPASARLRGADAANKKSVKPAVDPAQGRTTSREAVVLLDEIDKADPDVPNDLLEALDVERFTVDELDDPVQIQADPSRVLVMMTSNGERELPPAFLRRCVMLNLEDPTEDRLVAVANDRFGSANATFHRDIAQRVMGLRTAARERNHRAPSTAEYLDAVEACAALSINSQSSIWNMVTAALLSKGEQLP